MHQLVLATVHVQGMGSASELGLAVMTAIATARGADQIGSPAALVDGFQSAFLGAAATTEGSFAD